MPENTESYSILKQNKKLMFLFYALFIVILALIIYIYKYIFWSFLFALVFFILLRSVYSFILKYLKVRWICSTLIVLLVIVIILIPLFFIMFSLADQAFEFYLYLQEQYRTGLLNKILQSEFAVKALSYVPVTEAEVLDQVVEILSKSSLTIFSNLTGVLTFSIKLIINIFFMLLILFFLFKDGEKLSVKFYGAMPFPDDIEREVVKRLNSVIKVLLEGNLLIMVLQGLVVGIAFVIFGLPVPLLWGCVTAVLSLIPVIGTTLIWVPAVAYLIVNGSVISAIILGIVCLTGYLVLENLVKPKIFGKKLNFHPLIFFFLLIGSIQAFNLPGIILGPLLLTFFFSLWELYKMLNEYGKIKR